MTDVPVSISAVPVPDRAVPFAAGTAAARRSAGVREVRAAGPDGGEVS